MGDGSSFNQIDFDALLQGITDERVLAACDIVEKMLRHMAQEADTHASESNAVADVGFLLTHHGAVETQMSVADKLGIPSANSQDLLPQGAVLTWAVYRECLRQLQAEGLDVTKINLPQVPRAHFQPEQPLNPGLSEELLYRDPTGVLLVGTIGHLVMIRFHPALEEEQKLKYMNAVIGLARHFPFLDGEDGAPYQQRICKMLAYTQYLKTTAQQHISGNAAVDRAGNRIIPSCTIPSELIVGAAEYVERYCASFGIHS